MNRTWMCFYFLIYFLSENEINTILELGRNIQGTRVLSIYSPMGMALPGELLGSIGTA